MSQGTVQLGWPAAVAAMLLVILVGNAGAVECLDYSNNLHAVPGTTDAGELQGIDCSGDIAYVVSSTDGLLTFDVSVAGSPLLLDTHPLPEDAADCVVDGDRLYVAAGTAGVMVFNIATSRRPIPLGTVSTLGEAVSLVVRGGLVYVAAGSAGLEIFGILGSDLPQVCGRCDTPGTATAIDLVGEIAYVADGDGGLQVIDASDRHAPLIVAIVPQERETEAVTHHGTYLYVGVRYDEIRVYDVSDPADPRYVGGDHIAGFPKEFAVRDGTLFALSGNWMSLYELSSTGHTTLTGRIYLGSSRHLAWRGDSLVVTSENNRLWAIDTTHIKSAPILGVEYFSGAYTNGASLIDDRLFIGHSSSGISVVDVADPAAPRFVAQMPVTGYCFNAAVEGDFAFIAAGSGGFVVYDIRNLPMSSVVATIPTPNWTYDVDLTPGYAHVAVSDSGYWIIDISNPSNPTVVSQVYTGGRNYNLVVRDGFTYVACGYSGLRIVDVRDPLQPEIVGWCDVGASSFDVALSGDWLFIDEYFVGIHAVDVSDPSAPVQRGFTPVGGSVSGLHIDGDVLFASASREGLMVIDVSDPTRMRRLGLGQLVQSGDEMSDVVGDDRAVFTIESKFGADAVRSWHRQCAGAGDLDPGNLFHDGDPTIARVAADEIDPAAVVLSASPNPFNPATSLRYEMERTGLVTVAVYDLTGRVVRVLVDEIETAGVHDVLWDGRDSEGREVPSGVYFSRLEANGQVAHGRMTLVR